MPSGTVCGTIRENDVLGGEGRSLDIEFCTRLGILGRQRVVLPKVACYFGSSFLLEEKSCMWPCPSTTLFFRSKVAGALGEAT